MENQTLSPHFQLSEFINSPTARAQRIENNPNAQQVANLRNLCVQVLEPLRAHLNEAGSDGSVPPNPEIPLRVSSGFRCPELNKLVGGATHSQHLCLGTSAAADLAVENPKEGREWILWIEENADFDQVFLEKNARGTYWVHVSCRTDSGRNRRQVLKLQMKERR